MLVLAVALSLAGGVALASAADTLRWKFKQGEVLRYTMVQETKQQVQAKGQKLDTTLTQTVNLRWKVTNVSGDGVAQIAQTIDRVRTKIQSPVESFEYDSASDKAPEGQAAAILVPLLKSLVGAEFTFKMDPLGQLSEIKVPPKLVESLQNQGPLAQAGGMFSEEGLKSLISQSSLVLPKEALEKGKTWEQKSTMSTGLGKMIRDRSYTFQGPAEKPGLLKVSLNSKVSLEPAGDSPVNAKFQNAEGKGEFLFDAEAGHVVASKVSDRMEITLSVQGQDFKQVADNLTSMTLDEGEAPK
jgi:hypothetical protein